MKMARVKTKNKMLAGVIFDGQEPVRVVFDESPLRSGEKEITLGDTNGAIHNYPKRLAAIMGRDGMDGIVSVNIDGKVEEVIYPSKRPETVLGAIIDGKVFPAGTVVKYGELEVTLTDSMISEMEHIAFPYEFKYGKSKETNQILRDNLISKKNSDTYKIYTKVANVVTNGKLNLYGRAYAVLINGSNPNAFSVVPTFKEYQGVLEEYSERIGHDVFVIKLQ